MFMQLREKEALFFIAVTRLWYNSRDYKYRDIFDMSMRS